jgi:hypothetical protein
VLTISVRGNFLEAAREVSALAQKQLPFVLARTVTVLAGLARDAEKKAMPEVFSNPTPFTVNSVAIQSAKKGNPVARVFVRDIAAQYLAPYEYGGLQHLGAKPANLVPVNAAVNAYGNLPRSAISRYLGRSDVFMGSVKTSRGEVYGVWQRPTVPPAKGSGKTGAKGRKGARGAKLANTTGKLRLLVSFDAPVDTTKRLEFGDRALAVVNANFDAVFSDQLARAMASAKP